MEFLRKGVLCCLPCATPAEPGYQEASYLKKEAKEPLKLGKFSPVCDITSPGSPSRTGHPGSLDPAPYWQASGPVLRNLPKIMGWGKCRALSGPQTLKPPSLLRLSASPSL